MQQRGVQHFTTYEVIIDGNLFVLKCEAKRNKSYVNEHPY